MKFPTIKHFPFAASTVKSLSQGLTPLLLCLSAALLLSAKTGRITLSQPDDFSQGKFQAAELSSKGKILAGREVKDINVDAAFIWSMLETGADELLIGSGNNSKLYRYSAGKMELVFQDEDKERLAVSEIVPGEAGAVYFSVIPKSAVYLRQGKEIKKLAEPGLRYIFSLKYIGKGRVLVGGGPAAKVVLVKPDGKVENVISLDAEQVMDIIDAGNGEYIAATSKPGLLVSFKLDGSYRVLYAFQQEEATAVRMLSDKSLIVAVNQGSAPPPGELGPRPEGLPISPQSSLQVKDPPEDEMGQIEGEQPGAGPTKPPGGRAAIYRLYSDKGLQLIFLLKQGTILSLDGDEKNGFFVGTDDQGRVYRVFPDREEVLLSFDLQTGKVVSFAGSRGEVRWIGTAQPAKLFRIEKGAAKSSFQSQVLDAQFPARWGVINWTGKGSVKFATRSGNVQEPDASWSKWQDVGPGNPSEVKSPQARYIQFRAEWASEAAEIERVEISYRDVNQAEYITQLAVTPAGQQRQGQEQPQQGKNKKVLSDASKRVQINWRIENPDQDRLLLELSLKNVSDKLWTMLAKGDELKASPYQWDASDFPDGFYQVKLTASDAPDNSDQEVFTAEKISSPFIIDAGKPELSYKVSDQALVAGKAEDSTSAIAGLEYFVDESEVRLVASKDGVLDEKAEEFEFSIKGLAKGPHMVFMRACDQADNCAVVSREFAVK